MDRKRWLTSIVLLLCTLVLCCGCTETTPGEPDPTATPIPHYEFQGIRAGMRWADAQAVFGAPENTIREDGGQTTYTYPHFMVMTVTQGGQESVSVIRLRSDAMKTARGAVIGDTKEDVIKKEGKDYITDSQGRLVYTKQETILRFLLDVDGMVYAIEYTLISGGSYD